MTTDAVLAAIVAAGRRLYARNLLAAGDGNISFLLDDGRIAITRSGVAKGFLVPDDVVFLAADGTAIEGRPSAERLLHLAVYRSCPAARAVIHAHPPTAIAWTLAHPELEELPADALPEVILTTGRIPIVPYARPGSPELGVAILPFLPDHRLMVLARHGALCWGETLDEAVHGMERLEHVATILGLARELGGAVPLPADEIDALRQMRTQLGPRIL